MALFDDVMDDPQKQGLLTMALGLLAPKQQKTSFLNDVGQSGLLGMQAYGNARAQERANRQNELTQIATSYKVLKDLDQQNYLDSQMPGGKPYQTLPALTAMEQRMGTLMGSQPMQTGIGARPQPAASPAPQASSAPAPVQMPAPGMAPPSQSIVANRDYQPPVVRPQAQAAPSAAPAADLPSMLQAANIPIPLAQMMIRTGQQAKLYEMIGEALKPKNGPAGVTRINPVNGQLDILGGNAQPGQVPFTRNAAGQLVASPIQGAAEEVARAEGLKTQATKSTEAQYTPLTVPLPGGNSYLTTVGRFVGGQQPNTATAPNSPVARLDVTQPSRQSSFQGAGVSQTPADQAQQVELSKFQAQTFIDTQQAGRSAASGLQKLDRIDQLMQGVDTGKLTPAGMQVSAYAQSLGIPIDPKLPNKQAAEALTGQIALELRNPSGGAGMPGALSDNDLKFLRSMTPGLAQTTEGRQMIIETKRKILQRDQQVAQLARDYRKQNSGKLDDGFQQTLADYSASHPLFPMAQQPTGGFRVLGKEP